MPVPASSEGGGGAATTLATTAPAAPATGDLWLNTTAISGTADRPLSVWSGSAWIPVALAHYDGANVLRGFLTFSDAAISFEHYNAAAAHMGTIFFHDNGGLDLIAPLQVNFQSPILNGGTTVATLLGLTVNGVITEPGIKTQAIGGGALPTQVFVSGVGAQILTTRDVEAVTPVTFNPGAATTATCTVALSPDNVTYSTLGIETEPAGVAFDGTIHLIRVYVPAAWYLRLTVNAQAVLGTTTYY